RDIPSVAQNTDYSKIGIIALVIVGTIAIILIAMDGLKESQPKSMITPEETLFKTASMQASGPYIQEPEPEQTALSPVVPPAPQAVNPMELQMAQEALRRAKEAEAEMKKRIFSPQIVFDKKSPVPFATSISSASSGGGTLMGGDPNVA